MSFRPTAAAFVPGSGANSHNQGPRTPGPMQRGMGGGALGMTSPNVIQSMSGMNLSAKAWVPPSADNGNVATTAAQMAPDEIIEDMVEINVHGHSYYIPESMTQAYQDGSAVPDEGMGMVPPFIPDILNPVDIRFDWANGSTSVPAPPRRTLQTIGIPEPIRQHFQNLDIESLRQMAPDDERYKEIPQRFHSCLDLDESIVQRGTGGSFGYPSSLYKVIDSTDNQIYALRRFDNVRTSANVIKNVISRWADVRHPNLVTLHSVTQEKGAVFFSYAYHPAAQTLKQKFIDQRGALLNESLLWRILVQILLAIRYVHSRGMAFRVINPIHVLLTSGTIARVNCVGVPDVIEFESRKSLAELESEDLVKLGHLALSLASRAMVGSKNMDQALGLLQQHFSAELNHVVSALISGKSSVSQLCHMMADKIQDELESTLASCDALHSHLRNEYENGRLLRLAFKLGFINERPEYSRAPQWSETGDRYVLKLFRDYVFHQTQLDGAPALDFGHIVTSLNKVDMGDTEKLMLSSRDNKDLLVVSFSDVKRCLEAAFIDLEQQALTQQQQQQHQQQHQQMAQSVNPALGLRRGDLMNPYGTVSGPYDSGMGGYGNAGGGNVFEPSMGGYQGGTKRR